MGILITKPFFQIFKTQKPLQEAIYTEEVLSRLEDAAVEIEEDAERTVVGSIDAKGLYPNLNMNKVAAECGLEFLESPVQIEGLDVRAALIYCASNATEGDRIRA